MSLKLTPGGIPLTPARRLGIAVMMGFLAWAITIYLLFKFGSSEPIVNDYPLLKLKSLISKTAAYWAAGAERENMIVHIYIWLAVAIALTVGFVTWRKADPNRQKQIISRGQKADSDAVHAALQARLKKSRD